MTEELKPCPFCGGRAIVFHDGAHYADTGEDAGELWVVGCTKCDAMVGKDTVTEAIAAWNRRAS